MNAFRSRRRLRHAEVGLPKLSWLPLYAGWAYLADAGASRHGVLRLLLSAVGGAVAAKAP